MIKTQKFKRLAMKYNLGLIQDIERLKSSQNEVFKIVTDKGNYVIKEYTKDAIGSYYYLRKRKEQIRISEIFNRKGIKTIRPLNCNKKIFTLYKNNYYVIYDYFYEKPKTSEEITIDNIKELALVQSKIHKLNIKSTLPCSYKTIKIDIEKYLKKALKINNQLYNKINDNKDKLIDIIDNCNASLKKIRNNLCVSHNDYKLLNVLWKDEEPILIDFDAMGLSNPTCSLCESAFTFSNYKTYIRYDYYEEYLKSYIKFYGKINENYIDALYASFNGKLQWLNYILSKNHLKTNNYIFETIDMIDELILYYNNIEKFNMIFEKIIVD